MFGGTPYRKTLCAVLFTTTVGVPYGLVFYSVADAVDRCTLSPINKTALA